MRITPNSTAAALGLSAEDLKNLEREIGAAAKRVTAQLLAPHDPAKFPLIKDVEPGSDDAKFLDVWRVADDCIDDAIWNVVNPERAAAH